MAKLAAGISILLGAAAAISRVAVLDAQDAFGELRFIPDSPMGGEVITVEYRSHPMLAGQARLVLRGRLRTARDGAYNTLTRHEAVTELTQTDDGVYHGQFVLPDSIVYAVFAVEGPEGRNVDSNRRELWELLVHTARGVPSYEALKQKSNDLMGRNWELAYETARQAADLYPENPTAWSSLQFFERNVLGEQAVDSLQASHHARALRFRAVLERRTSLSGDDLGIMMWYVGRSDTVQYQYWRGRLLTEASTHPLAVQERTIDLLMEHYPDPVRLSDELEMLWNEVGPAHRQLLGAGYGAAVRRGDPGLVLKWVDRVLAEVNSYPWTGLSQLIALVNHPELQEIGLERLRSFLPMLDAEISARRRLVRTVDEQEVADGALKSKVFAALGEALIKTGNVTAGLDTLDLAADGTWDLGVFRQIADTKLALGDTVGAVKALANIAVDPNTERTVSDSVFALATQVLKDEMWDVMLAAAHDKMVHLTLRRQNVQSIDGKIRLRDRDGNQVTFDKLHEPGQITFLVFWSRYCGPALQALPRLDTLAQRFQAEGINVIVITEEQPSDDFQQFLADRNVSLPFYHDTRADAHRTIGAWGTPSYFLMDWDGRIRFAHGSELDDVLRQVEALKAIAPDRLAEVRLPVRP